MPSVLSDSGSRFTQLLSGAGSAALTVTRHLPLRALLWALAGCVGAVLAYAGSLLLGAVTLGGGAAAMLRGTLPVVGLLLPLAGGIVFGLHGVQRGVAHAALALEQQWGLIGDVIGRAVALIEPQVGRSLADLPLAQAEARLKQLVHGALGRDRLQRGGGLAGWLLRRVRRLLDARIEIWLLRAYRAEVQVNGGGGVDLVRLGEGVAEQLREHLRELLLDPLNLQCWLLLGVTLVIGLGWYHLGLGLLRLFS